MNPTSPSCPTTRAPLTLDYRYAPPWWRTAICLIDDWQKTLVDCLGHLFYEPYGQLQFGFRTTLRLEIGREPRQIRQTLQSARIPIISTAKEFESLTMTETAFAAKPLSEPESGTTPRRVDFVRVDLRNTGSGVQTVEPEIVMESEYPVSLVDGRIEVGESMIITLSHGVKSIQTVEKKTTIQLEPISLPAGSARDFTLAIATGKPLEPYTGNWSQIDTEQKKAATYWTTAGVPYDRIQVPDHNVQALLDSSIRNIYQVREIKDGLPAFQVGPEVYRGMWVVDGAFLTESVSLLGRTEEARRGIEYLLSFQKEDGSFLLIPAHWKETGIMLWAMEHHARLTGDSAWLNRHWPNVEKCMGFIQKMRHELCNDPAKPNYRLIPDGISDGGIQPVLPEYTNIYWTLVGIKAAIRAARYVNKNQLADQWQTEYDDFYRVFRQAAERDMTTDTHGNRYLHILMNKDHSYSPQKAQWAFLHAIYPGQLFEPDDPLVTGNLAMLKSNEVEGLVRDTGWLGQGLWTYFGSFYGHARLWLGQSEPAIRSLYDFGNHASPTMVWREEHMPQGEGEGWVGDMPHNWASAEFIRLVRHLLVLERGDELHLLEGMPASWIYPGATLRLNQIVTEFGPMSLALEVSEDGKTAQLDFQPPKREIPKRCVLHLKNWSGRSGTFELSPTSKQTQQIDLSNRLQGPSSGAKYPATGRVRV